MTKMDRYQISPGNSQGYADLDQYGIQASVDHI